MRATISSLALVIGTLGAASSLDGSYSIINPSTTSQILYTSNINSNGTCPMGEDVMPEIWHRAVCIDDATCNVGENSETWSHTFTPPPLYWTPVGDDWVIKLRDSGYELKNSTTFTVIGFGA